MINGLIIYWLWCVAFPWAACQWAGPVGGILPWMLLAGAGPDVGWGSGAGAVVAAGGGRVARGSGVLARARVRAGSGAGEQADNAYISL